MRLTLPSVWAQIILVAACRHSQPPVPPGPPIPAEDEVQVGTMEDECAGLEAALDTYAQCKNIEADELAWVHANKDYAEQSFAAGKKASPDKDALHAMAVNCKKAALSVHFATIRCQAGPKPRQDY